MDIKQATLSDMASVCKLADQVNYVHHKELPDVFINPDETEGSRAFWTNQLEANDSAFLVAKIASNVVGFITAKITENTEVPFLIRRKVCRIGTIVVLDSHQNKGIGGKLMSAIEEWAADSGAKEVRLEVMAFNENARLFYYKCGYLTSSQIMAKIIAE